MKVRVGTRQELDPLLRREHYLGPLASAQLILVDDLDGEVVSGQVWKRPTARGLPSDGSWLELSRWCLTQASGPDAGSRFHGAAVRVLREIFPTATTLVSYSDPSVGHTGTLYRACNWRWCPTWHRLRTPPTGNGDWGTGPQSVKDRWVYPLRRDPHRAEVLQVKDPGAIRFWAKTALGAEIRLAERSLAPDLARAASELGPLVGAEVHPGVDQTPGRR